MIPLFKVYSNKKIPSELKKVFDSGYIGQGKKVEEFETKLHERFGGGLVLTTNSATSAEHLALRLISLEPGDEVLTTPLTCTATNWPLMAFGAKIKWVDVDPLTMNICLKDLARKLTAETKLIVYVNWGGYPIDYDELDRVLSKHYELFPDVEVNIIEDCAHSFDTRYQGQHIASRIDGIFRFFSFQAIKHLTCGDGGCLIVPNLEYHRRGKLLRWYGIDRECNRKDFRCEADIPEWGYKFHMNDINATIGLCNLQDADWIMERHRENALYYNCHLQGVNELSLTQFKYPIKHRSSYWLYTVLVERRDDFMKWMKECGIMVSRVHERNDKHSCVSQFRCQLPQLDLVCECMVCIPVGWWVTREQRAYIADCIKKGW